MRKMVIGLALLAVTVTMPARAVAEAPGSADPLGLASVGLIIPFFSSPGNLSRLELASPVGDNVDLHITFFNATCSRILSAQIPLTKNDIAFVNPADIGANFNGLALVTGPIQGVNLVPLSHPIHARVRWTSTAGRSFVRTLDPITVRNAEGTSNQTWNPLRTAATMTVPRQTPRFERRTFFSIDSTLYLICPTATIIGHLTPDVPLSPPAAATIQGVVYDADEVPLRDWQHSCSCLTTVRLVDIDSIYSSTGSTAYYTEMSGALSGDFHTSFTGYVGTDIEGVFVTTTHDFTRLQNGSYQNIILGVNERGGDLDTVHR